MLSQEQIDGVANKHIDTINEGIERIEELVNEDHYSYGGADNDDDDTLEGTVGAIFLAGYLAALSDITEG